jgi:hypothetical protein
LLVIGMGNPIDIGFPLILTDYQHCSLTEP